MAAPQLGIARDDAKNRSRFFRGSARRRKQDTHRTDACVGTGRVGRGRGKGGGVLLPQVTALFLGEGTRHVTMEIAPWCGATICILTVWRIFYRGKKKESQFWLHSGMGKCCPPATVEPES